MKQHCIPILRVLILAFFYNSALIAANAQCRCLIESQITTAGTAKYGFLSGCTICPTPYYIVVTITANGTYTWPEDEGGETASFGGTCVMSNSTSAIIYVSTGSATDGGLGTTTVTTNSDFDPNGGFHYEDNTFDGEMSDEGLFTWIHDALPGVSITSSNCIASPGMTTTELDGTYSTNGFSSTYMCRHVYSDECSNAMMAQRMRGMMAPYPDPSYPWNWFGGVSSASFNLSTYDNISISGSRTRYRLKVSDSVKGKSYQLTWAEKTQIVTEDCTGATYTNTVIGPQQSETIIGTGDPINPAVGGIHNIDVPTPPNNAFSETIAPMTPVISSTFGGSNAGDGGPGPEAADSN